MESSASIATNITNVLGGPGHALTDAGGYVALLPPSVSGCVSVVGCTRGGQQQPLQQLQRLSNDPVKDLKALLPFVCGSN